MRKFFITLVMFILLIFNQGFSEEKPVEAWISYKQVNGKVVEVVKIKTNTGKVYEIYPGLAPHQIPKVENRLPQSKVKWILLISLAFLVGGLVGGTVIWYKFRREEESP